MKIFIDTADIAEIRDLATTGLADGVNPLPAAKSGRNFVEAVKEICTEGMDLTADIVQIYETYPDIETEVLVVLRQMFNHPLTEKGLAVFLADQAKAGQSIL